MNGAAKSGRLIPLNGRRNASPTSADGGEADEEGRKRSVALQLVDLALEGYCLGVSEKDEPFAVSNARAHIALPLRGGRTGFRQELAQRFFELTDSVPSAQALTDAFTVLEGMAARNDRRRVYLRVAEADGNVYIDCGKADCQTIRIANGSWEVVDTAPVLFRRTKITGSMAAPVRGGCLDDLWRFALVTDADKPIVLAVLVHSLIQPDTPHAILTLVAEQGQTKSTTTRTLVDLIDPSPVPLRRPPRDQEAWSTAACASWVVALDNLSEIPKWLCDLLCRAATGEGDLKRALYTDDDVAVIQIQRCLILNGIDLGALPGDLVERMAFADLDRMKPGRRRTEAELALEWQTAKPAIFGGLLDLAAHVHERLAATVVEDPPRMADFAQILAAVDAELGTAGLSRYRERAGRMAADSLTSDEFIGRILALRYQCSGVTAGRMLADLTPEGKDWRKPRDWPRSARAVTTLLRRHAPALRQLGWTVYDDGGRNKANVTHWTVAPAALDEGREPGQPSSPASSSQLRQHPLGELAHKLDDSPEGMASRPG